MIDLAATARAIEGSALGIWVRESASVYPAANVVHLLGLVMLVGGIGIVDLRAAGLLRILPFRPLASALTPIAVIGFVLLAATGPLLFAADATALVGSDTFRLKLLLIAIALANVLLFRWLWREKTELVPPTARVLAIASIALWLAVATLGRLIAYR